MHAVTKAQGLLMSGSLVCEAGPSAQDPVMPMSVGLSLLCGVQVPPPQVLGPTFPWVQDQCFLECKA